MTPDRIYILESFYKNIFYRKVWWEGRDDRQIYKKYILKKFYKNCFSWGDLRTEYIFYNFLGSGSGIPQKYIKHNFEKYFIEKCGGWEDR